MYDLMPPTACFCGCGRSMSFGRVQSLNGAGKCLRADVEALGAALEGAPRDEELAALVAEAQPLLDTLRDVVHGDCPESAIDRPALRAWWQRALPVRDRVDAAAGGGREERAARFTPRQLAVLHELGALSEMQVWGRFGMAG